MQIGDSITKHMQRFAPKYNYYFPASTVVNAGISGNTVEAILYRVETMNFPKSVSNISLLCGTNYLTSTSPSVISAKITKILTAIFQNGQLLLFTCFLIYHSLIIVLL